MLNKEIWLKSAGAQGRSLPKKWEGAALGNKRKWYILMGWWEFFNTQSFTFLNKSIYNATFTVSSFYFFVFVYTYRIFILDSTGVA